MKTKRVAALLMAALMLLGGCSTTPTDKSEKDKSAVETPFYEAEIPTMGNVYLTTAKEIDDEYSKADIKVEWEDGSLEEQQVKIKLRGNSSKSSEKKSYTVKYEEKVSFMDMDSGKKWALLGNPFDKTMLRVGLAFEYARALEIPYVSQLRYCKLYLNDEYMGVYIAMEPISDGKGHIDVDIDNGDAIFECDKDRIEEDKTYITAYPDIRMQMNEPEEPTDEQALEFEDFLHDVYDAIESKDHTEYEKLIDVDSFVNFYIFNEVVKDIDFGEFSTRYYRKDGKLYAGPPWDMDLSMGNVSRIYDDPKYHRYNNRLGYGNDSEDSAQELWATGNYYGLLMEDSYFHDLVCERWQEVLPITKNLIEANDLGDSLMDRYLEAYEEDILSNYGPENTGWSVWYQEGTYADRSLAIDYDGNLDELRDWLERRIEWLDEEFNKGE